MTEQGYVYEINGTNSDFLYFNRIRCHQHGGGNDAPPFQRSVAYLSCSATPFLSKGNNSDEERGRASYYLSNKLEFLNKEKEWFFHFFTAEDAASSPGGENTDELYSGRLFVRMPSHPQNYKFFSRQVDVGLNFDCSGNKMQRFELSGITFFANSITGHKCHYWKVLNNDFLYSSTSRKALKHEWPNNVDLNFPDLDHPFSNRFYLSNFAQITGNSFKFAEGKALEWQGNEVVWEQNLFAFNGWQSLDSASTIRIKGSSSDEDAIPPAKLALNTFKYNGQVNAMIATKAGSVLEKNLIQFQNFGNAQAGGVVTSGPAGTAKSRMEYNWIVDSGAFADAFRFDAWASHTFDTVTKNGTLRYNLAWNDMTPNVMVPGGTTGSASGAASSSTTIVAATTSVPFIPKVALQGDDHTVEFNSLLPTGQMDVQRDLGVNLCGMNMNSSIRNNLLSYFNPYGENCISDVPGTTGFGTEVISGLPANTVENKPLQPFYYTDLNPCSEYLRDCEKYDFRPIAVATTSAAASAT
ncbi:unnamed protein product [Amoebophrya sp. A120]|nr:unnamed protein product [Amoebophrya sp. A120]|eukprot:GSA120T00022037001.1